LITFHCNKRRKDGTPIIKDTDVIAFAEAQLADYRPELLEKPGRIDPEHFIEKYLGATIDYQDIYYEEGESSIAGATVFNDEYVRVFDKDNLCIKKILVDAGTIIIDNKTIEPGKEGYERFTKLHEAGHFSMHQAVYRKFPGQMSLFDLIGGGEPENNIVLCKRESIENPRRYLETEEDFREHQANVYAAALEMPSRPFRNLTLSLIQQYNIGRENNQILVRPHDSDFEFEYGFSQIKNILAEAFGASRKAVEVQLYARGLLMTEKDYIHYYDSYPFISG